ncbi:Hsp20/alpha crystallin family protein [Treponema pectinovorum]|uniref:Hsp20/alpha crystallin family protein n=1 Tax=Treponema pectinovorum TaxID=164 RepID=UPI003D8E6A4C
MNNLTLFNNLFDGFGFDGFYDMPSYSVKKSFATPKVDVTEEKDAYNMEMEIPGKNEKDIHVELDNNVLTISYEKKEVVNADGSKEKSEKTEKSDGKKDERKWILRERTTSSFKRSFTLPEDVDFEKISASAKDGILKVVMPRKQAQLPKKISINIA